MLEEDYTTFVFTFADDEHEYIRFRKRTKIHHFQKSNLDVLLQQFYRELYI